MRRWYKSMIDFCKIFLPCLCFFLQLFFIFSVYLLFSISVSCFLFFYFLCCLSLIYYKPPMQFFLGSCCQHLIFSIRIGSVKKNKTKKQTKTNLHGEEEQQFSGPCAPADASSIWWWAGPLEGTDRKETFSANSLIF